MHHKLSIGYFLGGVCLAIVYMQCTLMNNGAGDCGVHSVPDVTESKLVQASQGLWGVAITSYFSTLSDNPVVQRVVNRSLLCKGC